MIEWQIRSTPTFLYWREGELVGQHTGVAMVMCWWWCIVNVRCVIVGVLSFSKKRMIHWVDNDHHRVYNAHKHRIVSSTCCITHHHTGINEEKFRTSISPHLLAGEAGFADTTEDAPAATMTTPS